MLCYYREVDKYELVAIFQKDSDSKKIQKVIDQTLKKLEGKVEKVEDWGQKKLAFSIRHEDEGHYLFSLISLEPSLIKKMRKMLAIQEELLRFRIFRVKENGG